MDFYDAWDGAVEKVKQKVTGVGAWTALNCAVPVTLEDDVFVLGLSHKDSDLRGHLTLSGTLNAIEQEVSKRLGKNVKVEVIDGITINDWESVKRRREEGKKLRDKVADKDKSARLAAQAWDDVMEEMSRAYNAVANKSLPQSRALMLTRFVNLVAEAVMSREMDENAERNLGRAIERISTYTDVSPTLVAKFVLEKTGKL